MKEIAAKDSDYEEIIESLILNKQNLSVPSTGPEHGSMVLAKIFEHSEEHVRIISGNFTGVVSEHPVYLDSLHRYLKSGKKLSVLLTDITTLKNSMAYNLVNEYSKRLNSNIELRILGTSASNFLQKEINDLSIHFAIGDSCMYRIETDTTQPKGYVNFADRKNAERYNALFDSCFAMSGNLEKIYIDSDFERKQKIILPAVQEINIEFFEQIGKHPEYLQKYKGKNLEDLLDSIFKNQGFITFPGPGWSDGGIDLRLIQKDSIGPMLTLVQAKGYSEKNPIRLEAVQALSAIVDRENANRGLFVTTSRYLPGVEKWAEIAQSKIELANSEDIAKWCREIVRRMR